jgi:tyrosyl-tRNA synthetase
MDEVRRLGALKDAEINIAKKVLAFEVTKLVHGEEEATKAQQAAEALFGGGNNLENVPTVEITSADMNGKVIDVLTAGKIFSSKREARQMIAQSGLYIKDNVLTDVDACFAESMFDEDKSLLIRKGKKKYFRLIVK